MEKEQMYLDISSKTFKEASKEMRSAVKISQGFEDLKYVSPMQKEIVLQALQNRLKDNLDILSRIHNGHYQYALNLSTVRDLSKESDTRRNLAKRLKYANQIHQDLSITLYKLDLTLAMLLDDIKQSVDEDRKITSYDEFFEEIVK